MTMPPAPSLMALEAAESGGAVARQASGEAALLSLCARLRAHPPALVVTCARGSSDHAALYGTYLIETRLGVPVASIGPSVASVYGRPLRLRGALFVAASQSGRSPDLLSLTEAARQSGATVLGLVNDVASPLCDLCDAVLPLAAGPEQSVAATKSCLAAMAGFLRLAAHWSGEARLAAALAELPARLDAALAIDWAPALARLAEASSLFVIGRGPGAGIAAEMALKLKETCRLHAEAFSAAEVAHGPMALVGPGFPALAVVQEDAAAEGSLAMLQRMAGLGARVQVAGCAAEGLETLPLPEGMPPEIAPLVALLCFYRALPALARARGLDPDRPPHLRKITQTL